MTQEEIRTVANSLKDTGVAKNWEWKIGDNYFDTVLDCNGMATYKLPALYKRFSKNCIPIPSETQMLDAIEAKGYKEVAFQKQGENKRYKCLVYRNITESEGYKIGKYAPTRYLALFKCYCEVMGIEYKEK